MSRLMWALKGIIVGWDVVEPTRSPSELDSRGIRWMCPAAHITMEESSGAKENEGYVPIGALMLVASYVRPYQMLRNVPVWRSLIVIERSRMKMPCLRGNAYLSTNASLSLTLRTNARVRPSRDNSGRLAPPGEEDTSVSVTPVVRFLEKMAYMPE